MIKRIFIAFLLLFLIACQNVESITPPFELGSDPVNASQFGFIAKDDDWLYYIDGENNHNITRSNGTVKETYENTYGRNIQLHSDYIYYADFGNGSGLVRVHKDNIENKEIIIDVYISDYLIVNNYVFYITSDEKNSGLFRFGLDDNENIQLVEGMVNHMQWADGWIYYGIPSGGKVLKMNSAGKEKEELITHKNINISSLNFIVRDDWIYFENEDKSFPNFHPPKYKTYNIYRMNLNNNEVESVADGTLNNYLPDDGYIICTSNNQLKMVSPDGSNQRILYEGKKQWDWVNEMNGQLYLIDWNPDGTTNMYEYTEELGLKKIGQ